ncbi:polyhydroxyalkanoic acid synthase, PhaR subunit [Thermosyntropha lipolytica DSM 11003]|uniref:Polyhydroxyalkanoic acid synthase, PhaR subunit n=2 Tax=Thermosyntropha TaxID=54293 RepID=A0A1M5KJN3_9FIRM|nr:polyhydroxyalkanoic acid synthase, PhaR subunit [Thermosyntropha lipolytica DSM 11003]
MPEETRNDKGARQGKEEIFMPDFSDVWKEMYFRMEEVWANAVKEVISTKTFVDYLDKVLEYNLNTEKLVRQSIDKYMEHAPVPSKKDVARVAELVISMEEKIDVLEFEFMRNLETMAESLLKMINLQEKMQTEIASLKEDIGFIKQRLETMEKKEEAKAEPEKGERKTRASRKNEKKDENE